MKPLASRYRRASAIFGCAVALCAGRLLAQSPLLQITTIQVAPGNPVQFTFADTGTGATNYLIEFSPALSNFTIWSNVTSAVVQPLSGGNFHVQVPDLQTALGFFRVRGYGGAAGIVSASFNATALQASEGGLVSPAITFSAPYHGVVRYTVSGTAMSGDYVSLSGEVFVNGTSATIPVTLTDNVSIDRLRYLTLTLQAGPGYQLGAGSQTTITIEENDAEWQGRFKTGDATLGFLLKIQQAGSTFQAGLKSGGVGFFPTNELPASLTFTQNFFFASVPNIPVAGNATALNSAMNLTFLLSAMNGVTNQSVAATQVEGVAALVTEVEGRPHLNTTNYGTFLLLKPPVKPSTNEVDLVTVP